MAVTIGISRPMDDRFAQALRPHCTIATDHEARLGFVDVSGGSAASIRGTLEGPYCEYARTLPTTFSIAEANRGVTIVDPCFWTPQLPFLYRLRAEASLNGGDPVTVDVMMGLRRWEARGPNLRLERKRVVLRGAAVEFEELISLELARKCEVVLMMKPPGDVGCENASRLGVPLVVDLRGERDTTASMLRRLAWHPSVLMAILDSAAPRQPPDAGLAMLAVATVSANDEARVLEESQADVVAVELGPEERPPAWLASCGRPVIAIRRGVAYDSLGDARAQCDWLQRQLAPKFDLAGYFIRRK